MKTELDLYDRAAQAAKYLRSKTAQPPMVAIVLGTGLGKLVEHLTDRTSIDYQDIPHFPLSTVEYHSGILHCGKLSGVPIVAMQGRFHYYEGYHMQEVSFPIRVFQLMGIKQLMLSGAAGSLNPQWKKGDLMLLKDHINLLPSNPLIGQNDNRLGPRFPDMSEAYARQTRTTLLEIARSKHIELREGVYAAAQGPMLETAAEYRFLRSIGADAVGMSTVPEVITALHGGMHCAAVVVLTDECDPDNLQPVNIQEIIQVAGEAEERLISLLLEFFDRY